MTEAQTRRVALIRSHSVEEMPNGTVKVETGWGWLYLNADGTEHSREYR